MASLLISLGVGSKLMCDRVDGSDTFVLVCWREFWIPKKSINGLVLISVDSIAKACLQRDCKFGFT